MSLQPRSPTCWNGRSRYQQNRDARSVSTSLTPYRVREAGVQGVEAVPGAGREESAGMQCRQPLAGYQTQQQLKTVGGFQKSQGDGTVRTGVFLNWFGCSFEPSIQRSPKIVLPFLTIVIY